MYNNRYVILILKIIIYNIYTWSSNSSHCLIHLRHHQPSIDHYLLRIEYSINNEQICEHECSIDHLFQSISKSHRSNHIFSTFANCPQKQVSNVHCNYDTYVFILFISRLI
jgi:hypothetical protein